MKPKGDLLFSCIFGGGVYERMPTRVQDPMGGERQTSALLRNIITGEEFFMKRLRGGPEIRARYERLVLHPADRAHILWPSDMVAVTAEEPCALYVSSEYAPTPHKPQGDYALLFPYGGYPPLRNGFQRLSSIQKRTWENPEIRKIALHILEALESINRCGYVYADIHLSRFFFREDEKNEKDENVCLNFTELLYPFGEKNCAVSPELYPVEFAEPAIIRGLQPQVDFHSQNYSVSALLFYLFFGRYAYDGRLLDGYPDDSAQAHYIKFRDYHKLPVFIFDPDDRRNALGAFVEEEQVVALWQACPEIVREFFLAALRQGSAERTVPTEPPTPHMWRTCLREAGWENNGGG